LLDYAVNSRVERRVIDR
jgi:hypothetical protein